VYIQRPLTIHMGPESTCCDGKGRQRTEILSWPPAASSETWSYSWRFHLAGPLPTSSKFFHLTQILSREQGGFVVALGLVQNKFRISSQLPPLLDPVTGQPLPLPEMDAANFYNRTTYHSATVQWGAGGFVDCAFPLFLPCLRVLTSAALSSFSLSTTLCRYADCFVSLSDYIQDAVTGELLLRYSIQNVNVPAQGSIKCGLYRAHICSAATAVVGDFDFRKA
jgi:hypothetical protein